MRWNLEHAFTRWGGRVLVAGVVVIALAVARAPVARFAPVVYPESPAARLAIAALTLCLLYTSPSPRDKRQSRMPSSA